MFISFEGIDGSGKSTQMKLLASFLRSSRENVYETREPGWNNEISGILRHLILEGNTLAITKLFLLLADRTELYQKVILPYLKGGYGTPSNMRVLVDRSIDSTVAYQGYGEGILPVGELTRMNMVATSGVRPDLTFILDVSAREGLERSTKHNYFENKGYEFLEKVRKGFIDIGNSDPERCIILNGSDSIKENQGKIQDIVLRSLKNNRR